MKTRVNTYDSGKAKITVSVDLKIVRKAHDLGINISKACENTLKTMIDALEPTNKQKPFLDRTSFGKEGLMAGGVGFEPTTPNLGANPNSGLNWTSFKEYLKKKNYRGYYSSQLFNDAMQYSDCLFSRDLSRVKALPKQQTANILKALSALSKYIGQYQEYLELVKAYGLTWMGRSADDLIIDRLNKTSDPEEIWNWIKTVKQVWPESSEFMDLLSVTGLRYSEAIHSYNLIVKLSREKTLSKKYYNVKTGFLEHFRFKETFIRSCKKAFISYVPLELLESIGKNEPIPRDYAIRKILARRHVPQRFSDVRELNGSFMTEYLKEVEIDVLHGRVTGSVFRVHYLNVNLLNSLRARAMKGSQVILSKISITTGIPIKAEVRQLEDNSD